MLSNKKWIGIFSTCAVLAVVFRLTDTQLAKLMYLKGNVFGGFCDNIASVLPFILCSFSFAVLITCRNTRTTRTKNKILNALFGILSIAFAFIGAYYPYRDIEKVNYIVVAAVTMAITGISMYISYNSFKSTRQKMAMTSAAKVAVVSSLIIFALCSLSLLLPQRISYSGLMYAVSSYADPNDTTGLEKVPFIYFAGAAAAMSVWVNLLVPVIPKLKFSENLIFVLSCVWTILITVGLVTTGNVYFSEAIYGVILSYAVMFAVAKFVKKDENLR